MRRTGGRSARVVAAVHQAVSELMDDPEAEVTIPAVAKRAGVNPVSVYRRWGTREGLLADVAVARLERDSPLPDTGTLRGDLLAWITFAIEDLATPFGRAFLQAMALSMPATPEADAERSAHLRRRIVAVQERIFDRAAARGEHVPNPGDILDVVLAPLYLRALWGAPPPDPVVLVDRLLTLS
ncbi:TetR family transcriptional regulator [Kutzneria sp. CA-103260]|nr:TetR family transcriptional regulator [Kutzneria sp. CA-103260]